MTYCLNPQFSWEADHRVSCHKTTQMGWEGLDCVDLRTCSLRSVYEAWASVESGVQHALASYCMLRFQRTSKSRCLSSSSTYDTMILAECFPPRNIVFNHHQLRAGREGMAKIKSIIHAKLKARRLTSTQFVATKTKCVEIIFDTVAVFFPNVNLHIDLI